VSTRLAVLSVLTASAALAQPFPTVAPFPLELKRVPPAFTAKDVAALTTDFERLVRKAGADVPDSAQYAVAVRELKRQDCDRDDECLKQFAQLAHTLYGLYVELDVNLKGTVSATGRVVRSDGLAMGASRSVELPKSKERFGDAARNAISQLLEALGLGKFPAQRTLPVDVPKAEDPKAAPKLEPPPPPPLVKVEAPVPMRPGLRPYALIPAIIAGVAGIGAGVTYGVAANLHKRLLESTWPEGTDPVGAARTGQTLQLVSAGATGVAAVSAITALIFFLVGPSPAPADPPDSSGAGPAQAPSTPAPAAGSFAW